MTIQIYVARWRHYATMSYTHTFQDGIPEHGAV